MKKVSKWVSLLLAGSLFLGGTFLGCSHSSSGGGGEEPPEEKPPVTNDDTTALYRFNAKEDCQFADGAITAFDGDGATADKSGAYLYYPKELNLAEDNVVLEATVNFNNVASGRVGVGAIGIDGVSANGYAMLTGIQKVRYGKSKSLDSAMTENGQGYDSCSLTDNKVAANKDYTFKVKLESGRFTFEILDGETVVATKGSKFDTYFTASDKVFLAIGSQKGQTANATWSNVKVTVNGTSYNVNEVKNSPDQSSLSVEKDKTEINVDSNAEITFAALTKAGEAGEVSVESSDTSIATVEVVDGKIVITAHKAGSCTITVTNADNASLKKTIAVAVVDIVNSEAPSALVTYPAKDATNAYEDGEWMIGGFDADPSLLAGGRIKIYEVGADNALTEVDTIEFADEKQSVWTGKNLNVRDQLVRVENKAVYFTPHIGKIEASKKYLVAVPKAAIEGTIGSTAFEGLTNDVSKSSFVFTTRASKAATATMTVDGSQTSTADFRTIQGALRAIGADSTDSYTINVAKGTYHELLYFNGKADVKISGQTDTKYGADVIVQYDNATCLNGDEKTRNLLSFVGGDLVLENITLKNTLSRAKYGKADTQAEALGFDSPAGKFVAAYNCSFLSHQDTIRIIQKGWFYDCYIVGDVDFIWGETNSLACVIEKCKIESVYETEAGSNVARILASKTGNGSQTKVTKGFVILNSEIVCGSESKTVLGRTPWSSGTINQCAVINTNVISGSLEAERWEGKACQVEGVDQKYVGWKEYNSGATSGTDSFAVIDEDMYNKEYSGRRAILNRVIDISDKSAPKFIYDDSAKYDIDALIAAQGWTVDTDNSKETLDGEDAPDTRTRVTFDFGDDLSKLVDGKLISDTGYADDSTTKITAKVTASTRKNGDNAQVDGTVRVPVVSAGDTVVVIPYNNAQYVHYKFGVTGTEISSAEEQKYNATAADAAAGYVDVISTTNQNYYKKIEVRYTTLPNKPQGPVVVTSVYDFSEDGKIKDKDGNETTAATKSTGWSYKNTSYGLQSGSTNDYVTFPVLGNSVIGIQGYEGSTGTFDLLNGETVVKAGITAKTSKDSISTFFIYKGDAGTLKLKVSKAGNVFLAKVQVKTLEDEKEEITSIAVNDPGAVTLEGTTMTATVTASYCGSTAVTWSIANAGTTGATINEETGALSVTAAGTVSVKATSVLDSTKSATRDVTIVSYSINPFSGKFVSGAALTGLTTTGSTGATVFYTSDKTSVVEVNESTGALTKVGAGVATITAGIKVDGNVIAGVTTSYIVDIPADGSSSYAWNMSDMFKSGQAQGLSLNGANLNINADKNLNGVIVDVEQNAVTIRPSNNDMLITAADLWIPVAEDKKANATVKLTAYNDDGYCAKFKMGATDLTCDANHVYTISCASYDLTEKDGKKYLKVTSCGSGNNKYLNKIEIVIAE